MSAQMWPFNKKSPPLESLPAEDEWSGGQGEHDGKPMQGCHDQQSPDRKGVGVLHTELTRSLTLGALLMREFARYSRHPDPRMGGGMAAAVGSHGLELRSDAPSSRAMLANGGEHAT